MKPGLIIIGLGNPGKGYENTRHNLGFMAIDRLSDKFAEGDWQDKQKFLAYIQEARIGLVPVLLVKPKTYMNLSVDSVRKLVEFYKIDASSQLLIICDDIDLPLGEVRLRMKGGPGTHNGLRSIVAAYGEDFPRLRIGLGSPTAGVDLSAFVLSAMTKEERTSIDRILEGLPDLISTFVFEKVNGE